MITEAIVSLVVQTAATLLAGKIGKLEKDKRLANKTQTASLEENDTVAPVFEIRGDLGSRLLTAYEGFRQTGDRKLIEEYLRKASPDKEVSLVVEISRQAEHDARIQLGRPAEYVLSHIHETEASEFPHMAKLISDFIKTINTVHGGPKIHLLLSTPIALAFQVGQFVGLSHYNIETYQFSSGKYSKVPSVKRSEL